MHSSLSWPTPLDDREAKVLQIWRDSRMRPSSANQYLQWIRRFRSQCRSRGLNEISELTLSRATAFVSAYKGPRQRERYLGSGGAESVRVALHSWSSALKASGESVPEWKPVLPRRYHPLVAEYVEFRKIHRGVQPTTLVRDIRVASDFLAHLRSVARRVERARVRDLDSFVERLRKKNSRRTTADNCSALRCFLRFLSTTGRMEKDLAASVCAPRYRIDEFPPKVLPWEDVRKILKIIPRDTVVGRRDFAMLLLMATYGLGAAEVKRMRLNDISWRARILRVRRPKTEVPIELPLLPAIARAIVAYLKYSRPKYITAREIFVTIGFPHRSISSSVLRHQVRVYAKKAGLTYETFGSHLFRRSHATRQIDSGVNHKIVSDILGHRKPASTSVYIRVAFRRLRAIALPVPR
jgi:integrase/recombinase XerD